MPAAAPICPGFGGYHRLYEHKTRILRDREDNPGLLAMLPDFNERMCRVGAILIYYRAGIAGRWRATLPRPTRIAAADGKN